MSMKTYDFVILGGGIGGYSAAVRAAQLGKSVALVEEDKLGGTCLHQGCIPSKAYLRSAELYNKMTHSEAYGIQAQDVSLDFTGVIRRKQTIVDQLHQGVESLMKGHHIDVYRCRGRVMGPSIFSPQSGAIALDTEDEDEPTLLPKRLIIATGSSPAELPGLPTDGKRILNSDQALSMEQLPESIIIVGGGVIGVEWASMLNDFGVDVTIIETLPRLAGSEDEQISRELERQLKTRGVKVWTEAQLQMDSVQLKENSVQLEAIHNDQLVSVEAEQVLVSVGRSPNSQHLGLENTDVHVNDKGQIIVNKYLQTDESHIYAIGDVIGGYQLAHVAAREGILAVEHAAGLEVTPIRAEQIPRCIYSRPEVAAIGLTEQQAIADGRRVQTATIPFKQIGKAWVYGETEGFIKVIADRETEDILGVHMIGPQATELISEAALAQIVEATPWEVSQAIHPHPSMTEIMAEAMAAASQKLLESN